MKTRLPGLTAVTYADDSVFHGRLKYGELDAIMNDYRLTINQSKCADFRKRFNRAVPMRKTTEYLG